jgi:hypothetical protein
VGDKLKLRATSNQNYETTKDLTRHCTDISIEKYLPFLLVFSDNYFEMSYTSKNCQMTLEPKMALVICNNPNKTQISVSLSFQKFRTRKKYSIGVKMAENSLQDLIPSI